MSLSIPLLATTQTVHIPDANLRAAIETGLVKASGATITPSDMASLTWLEAATNLIFLYLQGNSISDISPLVANTGLGSGDEVNVRGNPLNSASISTHIPTLERRGVEFSSLGIIPASSNYTLSIPADT